jgi:hypothetical protein
LTLPRQLRANRCGTVGFFPLPVLAQIAPRPRPPPPTPSHTDINSDLSVGAAVTNLGSSFLERMGDQATSGFGSATEQSGRRRPRSHGRAPVRAWREAYGISGQDPELRVISSAIGVGHGAASQG